MRSRYQCPEENLRKRKILEGSQGAMWYMAKLIRIIQDLLIGYPHNYRLDLIKMARIMINNQKRWTLNRTGIWQRPIIRCPRNYPKGRAAQARILILHEVLPQLCLLVLTWTRKMIFRFLLQGKDGKNDDRMFINPIIEDRTSKF